MTSYRSRFDSVLQGVFFHWDCLCWNKITDNIKIVNKHGPGFTVANLSVILHCQTCVKPSRDFLIRAITLRSMTAIKYFNNLHTHSTVNHWTVNWVKIWHAQTVGMSDTRLGERGSWLKGHFWVVEKGGGRKLCHWGGWGELGNWVRLYVNWEGPAGRTGAVPYLRDKRWL